MTAPTGTIWAMKSGDSQPTNFASTDTGLVSALSYAATKGRVWTGAWSPTLSSTFTIQDGTELTLGPGDYTMSGSAYFSVGNGSTLKGTGFNSTNITLANTYAGTSVVTNTNQVGGAQSCMLADFNINGNRTGGATATQLIYIKGLGQPTAISNVVAFGGSGIGIKLEGISSNAASMVYVNNCWTNDMSGHGLVVTGPMGAVTIWRHSAETIPANKAGIYIDGTSSATDQGGIWITDFHCEALAANAIGILLEDSKDITVSNVLYFGSGGNGDLVKITGTALTNSYNITLRNLYVRFNATATTVNDVTNGVTLTNEVHYYSTGDHRLINNFFVGGATDITGVLTARAATANFGTAGTAHTHNVGMGGSGAAQSDLVVNSGSSGATQARLLLERNAQADVIVLANGTLEQFQYRHGLTFNTTTGAQVARINTDGKTRIGDSGTPSVGWMELAAGTTSIGPLYLGATGTLLTTALAGMVEWDATWLYFSPATSKRAIVHLDRRGTDIASAATIAIPTDGDVFHVTGTTNITNGITVNAVDAGRTVVLIFDGILTMSDTGTSKLSAAYVTTADDTLTLKCDGTNWYELARSAN